MHTAVKIIIGFDLVIMFFSIVMLIRTLAVGAMCKTMIHQLFKFDDYEKRLKVFRSVSMGSMILKFWKPIKPESFYKDTSFLK